MIRPVIETIYNRIKTDLESRVTDNVKIPKMSLLGVLTIVFAGSIHLAYGFLEWIKKQIFIDTADSYGRERWANILKIPRKAAMYTTGLVEFTGTATYTVPSGTIVINNSGLQYTTQDNFVIGTDTEVEVEASEAGEAYNTTEVVLTLYTPNSDIDSVVTILSGFDNGTDIEDLEDWTIRLLQRFANPPSSGNVADYNRWALSIAGVGKSWCFPAEDYLGAGTVGVYVATDNLEAVSVDVLQDVEDYIESVKPIPASVDYETIVPIPVKYYISLLPNTPALQDEIIAALSELHLLESSPGGTLELFKIYQAIGSTYPDYYQITDIRVNNISIGVTDIVMSRPDTAIFDNVIFASI